MQNQEIIPHLHLNPRYSHIVPELLGDSGIKVDSTISTTSSYSSDNPCDKTSIGSKLFLVNCDQE
ncbi:MAG TPA: hypothetical protein VD815_03315 [Candidatus Saccharimonadales bacterium]|nr:hypothetical protein [Candidatus Saccharimonadales bacterium]